MVRAEARTIRIAAAPALASERVTPKDSRMAEAVAFVTTILPGLDAALGEGFLAPRVVVVFGMELFYTGSPSQRPPPTAGSRSRSAAAAAAHPTAPG